MESSTTVTLSIAALLSAVLTLVSAVTAWVTVRLTVKHHAEQLARNADERERQSGRIASLERWRERVRGAQEARREDTDRILLPSAETRSDLHRGPE